MSLDLRGQYGIEGLLPAGRATAEVEVARARATGAGLC